MTIPDFKTKIITRKIADKNYFIEIIEDLNDALLLLKTNNKSAPNLFEESISPYFGTVWPAADGLAYKVAGLHDQLKNKNIIEMGCGPALASIVAAQYGLNITASDIHPRAPYFLERNCKLNSVEVPFRHLDWRACPEEARGRYDVVLASDVLYQPKHPEELARGMSDLVSNEGEVWLTDPGRGYLVQFLIEMNKLGFNHTLEPLRFEKNYLFFFRLKRDQA